MAFEIIVNAALLDPTYMSAATHHLLGIDPKMYRHFAIATIVISLTVAVLANGETQQMSMPKTQQSAVQPTSKKTFGKAKLADNRDANGGRRRNNGEFRGEFGAPMDGSPANFGDSSYVPEDLAVGPAAIIIEIDQAALARMSPQQRQAYLKHLQDDRRKRMEQGPFLPSASQVAALAASSAARSGASEIN